MTIQIGDRDDWRVDFVSYGGPFIRECGLTTANPYAGDTVAKVMVKYGIDGSDRDFPKTQQRAYLISAAPNMLAALKRLVAEVKGAWSLSGPSIREAIGNTNYGCVTHALEQAQSAIAKAEPPAVAGRISQEANV